MVTDESEWATMKELAAWRGETDKTLRRKLPNLYAMGFPRAVCGKWYLPACRAWAARVMVLPAGDPLMDAFDERGKSA